MSRPPKTGARVAVLESVAHCRRTLDLARDAAALLATRIDRLKPGECLSDDDVTLLVSLASATVVTVRDTAHDLAALRSIVQEDVPK